MIYGQTGYSLGSVLTLVNDRSWNAFWTCGETTTSGSGSECHRLLTTVENSPPVHRVLAGRRLLLQLRIFDFGLLQDGNIGVGVFPEGEEILIGCLGLGGVMLHGISPGQFQACERAER